LKPRNILVFGDYDVDGNSGFTAILLSKTYYPNIAIPISDRYAEGYGISFKGIDYLVDNCFLHAPYFGLRNKSIDHVLYAKNETSTLFAITTDQEALCPKLAVLDPKRQCSYPYDELCGCG
jgi:single-stranded-DNA-specific exonuclease